MNIRISADSTCDLSPELIEKYDIRITPLYIVRDGQSLVDGKDITPDEIYAHVNSGGGMCSTAAVSVYDYTQFFRRQLEECDAVVHFHISGDMSACYQNACIAAQEVGNVYPVDSRSLSTGIGQLVLEAAQLAREGKLTAQEIAHEMERRRELLDVSFLVERLDFLHKGGRCSGVALLGANMLNLRPCIQVKDGQMMVGKKYRGPYVSCLLQYIRERLKGRDDIDTRRIFITESGGFTRRSWRRWRPPSAATSPLTRCCTHGPAAPSPVTAAPARWASSISTPNNFPIINAHRRAAALPGGLFPEKLPRDFSQDNCRGACFSYQLSGIIG